MSKPSKRDTLDFLHQVRGYYSTTGLGYKILDYLEEIVNKQGGKNVRRKRNHPNDTAN